MSVAADKNALSLVRICRLSSPRVHEVACGGAAMPSRFDARALSCRARGGNRDVSQLWRSADAVITVTTGLRDTR